VRDSGRYREDDTPHFHPAVSADEAREIDAVVALLRALPDPEPRSDLTARVMRQVLEIESRPRLLRGSFRQRIAPRAGAVLAAGIACAAVGIWLQLSARETEGSDGASALSRVRATEAFQRPGSKGAGIVMPVGFGRRDAPAFFTRELPTVTPAAPEPDRYDTTLDAQLNELQLDPDAFFRRLDRVLDREHFVARLADRAARRGDAPQLALFVRGVPHPYAGPMVDEFLRASLVQQASLMQPASNR